MAVIMQKAIALWLIENTSLTFKQIADFCELHIIEVDALANASNTLAPVSPLQAGCLTAAEIIRCSNDPKAKLKMVIDQHTTQKRKRKYIPLIKRQERPNAIAWLLRNYPYLKDTYIASLVGSTKKTVAAIRDRSYHSITLLKPKDPVSIGLCSQSDLDNVLREHPEENV